MGSKKSKPTATSETLPPTAPSAPTSTRNIPPISGTKQSKEPNESKQRKHTKETATKSSLATKLADSTRYNIDDVRSLHEEFRSIASRTKPVNRITKEQFRDILSDHRVPWRSDKFVSRLFDYFDQREDGSINFGEFVRGLALASSGDPRDKLKLSFDVFDVEGTGTIARWEMRQVLEGIFVTADQFQHGVEADAEKVRQQKSSQIENFVNQVFSSYDKDQTNQLSFMEYMQAAMKYPKLTDFMSSAAMFNTNAAVSNTSRTAGERQQRMLSALEVRSNNQEQRLDIVAATVNPATSTISHVRPHHDDHHVSITRDQILKLKITFDRLSKETTESPNEIEPQQFKDVLNEFGIEWKNDDYLNRLFDVVDTHGNNTINYQECLVGLSMLIHGNTQEKLMLSFELFDVDGTGTISKNEMMTVLRASGDQNTTESDTAQFVERIFTKSDKNHSGTLTLREFTNAVLRFQEELLVVK